MSDNELDGLLAALEPPQSDATLPEGYIWTELRHVCIAPPLAERRMVKRARGIVASLPTAESIRVNNLYATMRFPILDRNHPRAVEIWEANVQRVMEYQKSLELKSPKSEAMATPANDADISSRPIRLIR